MVNIGSGRQAIKTIFIADDDSDDVDLFKEALSQIDPRIRIENLKNGDALLSLVSNIVPDLLFLDLDMPVKNGLQCLQHIRNTPATSLLPVVVFSSTTRRANIHTAYEVGANLFFIKPQNFKELVGAIEAILGLDWAHPELVKKQFCSNGNCIPFNSLENPAKQ